MSVRGYDRCLLSAVTSGSRYLEWATRQVYVGVQSQMVTGLSRRVNLRNPLLQGILKLEQPQGLHFCLTRPSF